MTSFIECPACKATGREFLGKIICPLCKGNKKTYSESFHMEIKCPKCLGKGEIVERSESCSKCFGNRFVKYEEASKWDYL